MVARLFHLFTLQRWLTWLAMHPGPVLVVIMILTAFAAAGIPRLTFSPSANDLMVDGLPEGQRYEAFKTLFGSDEIVRVVVKGGDMFTPEAFVRLRFLSAAFDRIPGVNRVISLPRIKDAVDPGDRWPVERFARLTAPVPIFQGNLISPDHRVSGITLILEDHADQAAVNGAVGAALSRLDNGYSGYQTGMTPVSIALARYTHQDFLRLPLYTMLVIAILLLVMPGSIVDMALPLFGVAVGTAYCLYVYCEFRNWVPVCNDACTTLVTAYSRTAVPTLISVCTTIAGIGSLMVTPIGAIRQFSGFACLGILAMFLAVMTFFPCVLVLAWPVIRKRGADRFECLVSSALVDRLVNWIFSRRQILFIVLAFFALVTAVGIFRIRVETNPLSYFKASTAIRRHVDDIHRHLSGSFPLHLELHSNDEDFFLSMAALRILAEHQRFLGSVPGVDKTLSFADYLMLVNYVVHRFDPAYYTLPDGDLEIRMLVNQFKSLLGRDVLTRYVSADFSTANITMLTRLSSSKGFLEAQKMIRSYCQGRQTGGIAFQVTGLGDVMSLGSQHLVSGQVWSLLLTIGLVFALMHKRIHRLWAGDVIGEMGLLTSGTRCVSVVSAVSGEVLSLSRNQLERIQRLYPRTASRFFSNLSTILTDRLIRADRYLSITSRLDDDTGLLNREAFFDCLEKEIHRARRFGDAMAICLLDVDDCDGAFDANQLMVEHLILQVARVISGCFRAIDTKGRLDSTTLAVLLPRTTSAHNREVCRRLKSAFRSQANFDSDIKIAIFCRFLDLDCCRFDGDAGKITGPVDVIPAALLQKDRHLLYSSSHLASG